MSALRTVPASRPPAVRTEALVRRFGATTAVAGIDLTVHPGEIYGFLGPNGAGKSTLIRMLCTLLRPSSGRAVVAGHDVVAEPNEVRLRIGVALQDAALDDSQTGRELLALQGRLYGLARDTVRRRVDEVLDLVSIGSAIDRRIGTYSGGMKRRLDLAAALIHGPELVFLDEPTTGLDPDSRTRVWAEVERLNRELGITIFLTTQYLEEADALAHRVGIIAAGRIVAEGPPDELKRSVGADLVVARVAGHDPDVLERLEALDGIQTVGRVDDELVIAASDGPTSVISVAGVLGSSGLRVESLTLRSPTLDDVFAELTGSRIEVGAAR